MNRLLIKYETLKLLKQTTRISFIVSLALLSLITLHLHSIVASTELLLWFFISCSILVIRLLFVLSYDESIKDSSFVNRYLIIFRIGAFASATLWGWLGYYYPPQVDPASQVYISFLLGGLIAGASSSMAADKLSIFIFVPLTIMPNILYYIISENESSSGMAIMLLLFTCFMIYSTRVQGKNLHENFELRIKSVENEKKIQHLAFYDSLTGLPNRVLFDDRIKQALLSAQREVNKIAILFIDLDGFKDVNDSFGHDIGDKLLKAIAKRYSRIIRSSDSISRFGGDEFIILLNKPKNVENIAEKILKESSRPVLIEEKTVQVSCSIGISIYPDHGKDINTLIKNADNAMYLAKEKGKNDFAFCQT